MKPLKKILLIQLPPPVVQALSEHLNLQGGIETVVVSENNYPLAGYDADLAVTGEKAGVVNIPGRPVLPLSFAQLHRLGRLLRQIGQMLAQPVLYIGDIVTASGVFKPQERAFMKSDGRETALTDREVDILAYLLRRNPAAVSREELLKNVWQYQEGIDTHTLETHIYRLRQKIEVSAEEPRLLLTVEGGYSLHLPEEAL